MTQRFISEELDVQLIKTLLFRMGLALSLLCALVMPVPGAEPQLSGFPVLLVSTQS